MVDIKGFTQDKLDGVASLAKTEDGTAVLVKKRFDPRTGEALPSDVTPINKDELTDKKIALQAEIDAKKAEIKDVDAFLVECAAAELL